MTTSNLQHEDAPGSPASMPLPQAPNHSAWRRLGRPATLPYALYRGDQVAAFDRQASARFGLPAELLMERAGSALFALLRAHWPEARRIGVLAGTGNNGGDGYVLARLALVAGWRVTLWQLGSPDRLSATAGAAAAKFLAAGGQALPFDAAAETALARDCDVLVDALFGTGLTRPVEGIWARAIVAANAAPAPVLAVDLPSGLHADTGAVLGVALRAEVTLTFVALKQGLFTGKARDYRGTLQFDALQLPAALYAAEPPAARRSDWAREGTRLPPRARSTHKGNCGHVLLIGGAPGMSGAIRLAGMAALRAGAGRVTLTSHPNHATVLNLDQPELMTQTVADADTLIAPPEYYQALAIGPGIGQDQWARQLCDWILYQDEPLVVDADALNLLAANPRRRENWILTPHPGEAGKLLGCATTEVERDRFAAARALQDRYGGVIVLKGAGTLIQAAPPRPPTVCDQGNPGMASAGMGDALTGILAALLAQGLSLEQAAEAGVCLHAAAGDRAARTGERGLLASDLIAQLRAVLHQAARR